MQPYLDLSRRKLEAVSTTSFNARPGRYSVSSELKEAGRLVEIRNSPGRLQSPMLSVVVQPLSLHCAHATRFFSLARVDDDTSTPEN
jgi:hypothetical protein